MPIDLQQAKHRFGILTQTMQSWKNQQINLENRLGKCREIVADLGQAVQVMQFMAEHLSEEAEKTTAQLASMALQETFTDQNLTLRTNHTTSRGQPAVDILMVDHDKNVEDAPLDSFGGGPSSMLGIVMRIITTIRRKNLQKILIMDEPTAQVSDAYAGPASRLIRKLADPIEKNGLGFDMLVVTHSQVLASHAHRQYKAELDEQGYLKVEVVNGVV